MYIMRGIGRGDLKLTILGSYYGEPDEYEPIIQPFLDAMVRCMVLLPVSGRRTMKFQPLAQHDVSATNQCDVLDRQSSAPRQRKYHKYVTE